MTQILDKHSDRSSDRQGHDYFEIQWSPPLTGYVYNWGPGRKQGVVLAELWAFLFDADILATTEAKRYRFPRRLRGLSRGARGRTKSRRNLVTYASRDLDRVRLHTYLMDETWARRPGRPGRHEPRAGEIQFFANDGFPFFSSDHHQAPKTRDSDHAREKWVERTVRELHAAALWGPGVANGDWNGSAEDVARRLRALGHDVEIVGGKRTDRVLLIGDVKVTRHGYRRKVGKKGRKRKLRSDHRTTLRYVFQVGRRRRAIPRDHGTIEPHELVA